ncbi:CamS family sex pheromone protein [Ammoniphilus resinae]|uniref:Protein involved in sex pheromone biosynthesis n=1 Tax=Ammoniphilus resinae TaxID=861532 RepID=A0ABS4GIK6_9BACL|nr:CamS family sex pheromone protein [Ammoniphilus resinae]MBP1930090.1 protein involved in sex pheromone biosynthesis [Ammoniphilus resinae]
MKVTQTAMILMCLCILCACSPLEVIKQQRPPTSVPIVTLEPSPPLQISSEFYQSEVPYLPNQTRGTLKQMDSRFDAAHLERGMLEYAKESFPTDRYLFREGQLVTRKELQTWQEEHPQLVNVLEHDYLNKETKEQAGIVLSISLNPRYKDESGTTVSYTDEELHAKGEIIAAEVSSHFHTLETNIPLLFLIYRTEPSSSMVPGRFIRWGLQENQQKSMGWRDIRENFYLLPSEDIQQEHPQLAENFKKLQSHAQKSFPEYASLIGLARFLDDKPLELTIKAYANYDSLTEVIQFTQLMAQKMDEAFEPEIQINLYVETIDRLLAFYIRPTIGDPVFHVLPGFKP